MLRTAQPNATMVAAVKKAIADPGWLNGKGKIVESRAVEYVSPDEEGRNQVIYRVDIFRVNPVGVVEYWPTEPSWLSSELESAAGGWEQHYDAPGDYGTRWFIVSSVQYGYV